MLHIVMLLPLCFCDTIDNDDNKVIEAVLQHAINAYLPVENSNFVITTASLRAPGTRHLCNLDLVSGILLLGLVEDVNAPLRLVGGRNVETGMLVLSDTSDLLIVFLRKGNLLEVGLDALCII